VFERYNIVSECDLVEAAQKLNLLQPVPPSEVRLKPDTMHDEVPTEDDRDGLASPKRRSREGGHNLRTIEADRGSRRRASL